MRAKGRISFIIREGILRYGVRVAFTLMVLQVTYIIIFTRESGSLTLVGLLFGYLLAAVFFGSLIGFVLWKQHERDYHKHNQVV